MLAALCTGVQGRGGCWTQTGGSKIKVIVSGLHGVRELGAILPYIIVASIKSLVLPF